MLKRRLKLAGRILLALIVLAAAFLLFERFRGQMALANYKRQLLAQGEKLSASDFVSEFNDNDNGAPAAFAAIARIEDGKVLPRNYPPRMKVTASGRAIVCFRENEWVEDKTTYRWEQLSSDLKTNEATLAEIQTALKKPVLNNRLDLSEGMRMKFPHLAPARSPVKWFGSALQLALREGRNHDAAGYLISEIGLPRLLAEDRLAISELVRIAIAAIARVDTWEALQADGWSDEDLADLQKAWEERKFATAMARSLEGEWVYITACSEQLRASNEDIYELLFGESSRLMKAMFDEECPDDWTEWLWEHLPWGEELREFILKQIYCRVWRFAWSYQAQMRELKHLQRLIEMMRRGSEVRSYKEIQDDVERLSAETSRKGFYDRLRFPGSEGLSALSKTILKAMRSESDRSLVLCAITLKRHSLRHGRLPESLDALVPGFLSAVPVDYMDGKPIRYRLNESGGFTLYSVGEDGKDDGGDSSLPEGSKSKSFRLRRDCVWPSPAMPEEVEEYRQKARED